MRKWLIDWVPSLRQFKRRFSRCKNITAEEWAGSIIPTIRKRVREGKESDVFIDGKQVEPKRVKTAMNRYASRVDPELETVDESQGMQCTLSLQRCYSVFTHFISRLRQDPHRHAPPCSMDVPTIIHSSHTRTAL